MTTKQEEEMIHRLLPALASSPSGFDLGEGAAIVVDELLPIARRLEAEGLALPTNSYPYYVAITPKGNQIAEQQGGYSGYLKREAKRLRSEERRAQLNAIGTFGSMVIAGLALLFSLYIYLQASEITKLEQKLQTQNARLKALEAKLAGRH